MEMATKTSIDIVSDVTKSVCKDIWFEIFKQLPVQTLCTCRCVCKTWHSLVASSSFIAIHLRHYTLNPLNSLLFYKTRPCFSNDKKKHEHLVFFCDSSHLKQRLTLHTSVFPAVVPRYSSPSSYFYLVGSVHGLLCISDSRCLNSTMRVFIWNPLVQKTIQLPVSLSMSYSSVLGFGFDLRRNDHRVVKINDEVFTPLVEVYSVQERTWRPVCSGNYLVDNSIDFVSQIHCFLNGVIHWLIPNKCLLLFDVSDEAFSKMELPEEIDDNIHAFKTTLGVFEYKGKLSVSQCHDFTNIVNTDTYGKCEIWVKQDYNAANSWCIILCIGMVHGLKTVGPVTYLGEDGELIMSRSNGFRQKLVLCNPMTKEFKEVGIEKTHSTCFGTYTPSLALLDLKIDHLNTTDELGSMDVGQTSQGRKGKNKRSWTKLEEEHLIDGLLELSNDPQWKADDNFKSGFKNKLENMLNKKISGCDLKVVPHIKFKIKWFKDKYIALIEMFRTSGFSWDEENHMIKCERQPYEDFCRLNKSARGLWKVPFPHFDKLTIIYGPDLATGTNSETFAEAVDNQQNETIDFSKDESDEDDILDDDESLYQSTQFSPTEPTSKKAKSMKSSLENN